MAIYGRGQNSFGFVYNNLGDLIKRVHAVGAGVTSTSKATLFQHAIEKKDPRVRKDSLEELKHNVSKLHEMQNRLNFMLNELEGLVKKG